MATPLFMAKYNTLFQKILNMTRIFWLMLALQVASANAFPQQYFFQNAGIVAREVLPADSPLYAPSENWGFFEQFRNEMEIERFLILNLSGYVEPERFFVSVRYDPGGGSDSTSRSTLRELTPDQGLGVQGEPSEAPGAPGNSTSERFTPPLNRLPVLPDFWERNKLWEEPSSDQVTGSGEGALQSLLSPGEQNGNSQLLESYDEQFLLGKLGVHFIIDPEISPEVEELMGKIAYYALKLYAFESYEITFERIPLHELFPKEEERGEQDSLMVAQGQKPAIDQQVETDWQSSLEEWFSPWALLFLILLGLLFYVLMKRKHPEITKERDSKLLRELSKEPEGKGATDEANQEGVPDLQSDFAAVGDDFRDYFVRHTQEIGKVFSHWIEDLGADGLIMVHTVLMPMGKNMYTLLFPYLSKDAKELLFKSFHKQPPLVREDERASYLKKLYEIILNKIGIESLALLTSLEKEELFALLDLLEDKDAAKALYHVELALRSEYLQRTPPFRAVDILMNVSGIRSMNKTEYERLGELVSEKLVELRFFRKYQKKDLQFMVESLDCIDSDVQEIILENLKSADPVLYQEIKKYQLSWSDIAALDPEFVREATLAFSSNELSIAFSYRPEEVEEIVSLRPEREQELIREVAKQKVSVSELEAKSILKRMLTAIKTNLRADEIKPN
jgi:flagellar motor switch protein FliG